MKLQESTGFFLLGAISLSAAAVQWEDVENLPAQFPEKKKQGHHITDRRGIANLRSTLHKK
jgi:hypothetical protein